MNKQEIINYINKKYQKNTLPPFRIGDTVRVHVRITEGNNTRIQIFEGVVLAFKGHGGTRTFTVRKISFGVGVERIFPLVSASIKKIEKIRSGHVKRAKLYYLRNRVGRASRLEEKENKDLNIKTPPVQKPAKKTDTPPEQELATAAKK